MRARATLVALLSLVRQRFSVVMTSCSASLIVSSAIACLAARRETSGAAIEFGQNKLAMTEGFRRGEPAVRRAEHHVDQCVAGRRDRQVAAQDARHVEINV